MSPQGQEACKPKSQIRPGSKNTYRQDKRITGAAKLNLAAGPTQAPYFTPSRLSVIAMVWLMNGLMTFYTYFKDYKGDRRAGKNTIIVKYGLRTSRYISIFSAFLPALLFVGLYASGLIVAPLNPRDGLNSATKVACPQVQALKLVFRE